MKTIKTKIANFLNFYYEIIFWGGATLIFLSTILIGGHYLIKFFELATGH